MPVVILNLAVSLVLAQAPPANAACSVLTTAQVTSLIGAANPANDQRGQRLGVHVSARG